MQGNFGNALMKAVTKAKRRVTLSICGLGMLDETEVETIPDVEYVEAEIEEPTNGDTMPLEDAKKVKNSEGELYHELETEKLAHMANALTKSLNDSKITDKDRDERLYKLEAIKVILKSRQ
jgi:hypothetical protein